MVLCKKRKEEKRQKHESIFEKVYPSSEEDGSAQRSTTHNIQNIQIYEFTFFKVKREKTKERHQLHPIHLRSKDCVSLTTIQKILRAKTMVLLTAMMKVIWRSTTMGWYGNSPPHQIVWCAHQCSRQVQLVITRATYGSTSLGFFVCRDMWSRSSNYIIPIGFANLRRANFHAPFLILLQSVLTWILLICLSVLKCCW